MVEEEWKVVELGVQPRLVPAQPEADEPSAHDAHGADREHEFHVVGRDVAVTVAEGLEQSDLAAFDRNQARQHHAGEQCGDQEKHRRQDARQRAQLLDLVHEEPVR